MGLTPFGRVEPLGPPTAGFVIGFFQRHGRWKSVTTKNGYIKDEISSRLLRYVFNIFSTFINNTP